MSQRRCLLCNKNFHPVHRNTWVCSRCPEPTAAQLAEVPLKYCRCAVCWAQFTPLNPRSRYCSDECRGRRGRASRWLILHRDKCTCGVCSQQRPPAELRIVMLEKGPLMAKNALACCERCVPRVRRSALLLKLARVRCRALGLPLDHLLTEAAL